jgi:hypothetical protein
MNINPFKGDPVAALDKARQKLVDVESNIAELQATRTAKLVISDGPEEDLKIDAAIAAERANAEIYKDRICALQEECRKAEYANREQQRSKAIAAIKQKLKRRQQIASDLQAAIERVGELYTQLMTRDEAEQHWPFPLRGGGFALDLHGVRREIAWLLHGLINQFRLPEPSSAGLGVTGITAQGIDGVVRQQSEAIISRLELAPIAEDLMDEAING